MRNHTDEYFLTHLPACEKALTWHHKINRTHKAVEIKGKIYSGSADVVIKDAPKTLKITGYTGYGNYKQVRKTSDNIDKFLRKPITQSYKHKAMYYRTEYIKGQCYLSDTPYPLYEVDGRQVRDHLRGKFVWGKTTTELISWLDEQSKCDYYWDTKRIKKHNALDAKDNLYINVLQLRQRAPCPQEDPSR